MSKLSHKVNQLSPDGYSRFYILTDIIKKTYTDKKISVQILDVGGGSEYMQQQLDTLNISYELTVLDILPKPANMKAKYIQGDATNMPFENNEYDIVISTDVLEHIPTKSKKKFVEECVRVSSDLFILAAPFNTPGVDEAEVVVNEFNIKLFGTPQNWLEEHLRLGKPNLSLVREVLNEKKIYYIDFGTQNITTWLLNTHLNLIDAKLGLSQKKHQKLNSFYNQNILSMNEFTGPTYRHFFIASKKSLTQKKLTPNLYSGHTTDHKIHSEYISEMFNLISQRIAQISTLESKIRKADEKIKSIEYEAECMKDLIGKQSKEIQEAAPLLRIARSRPYKKLRSISTRRNNKGIIN